LPVATSGLSSAIWEKSFVNDVAETDGTEAELLELLELELLDELPLLPQAAMTRAALPAAAVNATLLVTEYNETTSLVGGTCQDTYQRRSR